MKTIKALISFAYVDENGITTYTSGQVYEVSNEIATQMIAVGYAEEYSSGGGGSSDFSTAELTFTKSGVSGSLVVPFYVDGEQPFSSGQIVESGTYTMILYKGFCFATFIQDGTGPFNIVGNGDVEVDGTDIYITGDCTITIS